MLIVDGAQSRRKSIDHTTSSQDVMIIPSLSVEVGGGISAAREGRVHTSSSVTCLSCKDTPGIKPTTF